MPKIKSDKQGLHKGPNLFVPAASRGMGKGAPEGAPSSHRLFAECRPPVSGALLSHGLSPQYHRREAA